MLTNGSRSRVSTSMPAGKRRQRPRTIQPWVCFAPRWIFSATTPAKMV